MRSRLIVKLLSLALVLAFVSMVFNSAQVSASARENGAANTLAGSWLGPMPGNAGKCGEAYSMFTFTEDGRFGLKAESNNCGGFSFWGNYSVRNSVIYFHITGHSPGISPQDFSAGFRFVDANNLVFDDPTGPITYHRQ